ncbi:MAG: ComEC/Rec2 family competence protein [Coriobacteriia bacterium]|nr:ComEC/Rec2 family competence protein [Coriobacteriia bacterium]
MSTDVEQREVARPSLPPLAWAAGALAAGLWAAEALVWRLGAGAQTQAWTAVVGSVGAMVALAFWARQSRTGALCALALVTGVSVGVLFWVHVGGVTREVAARRQSRWDISVVSDATDGQFGASSAVRARLDSGAWVATRASWPKGAMPPEAGSSVVAFGSFVAQADSAKAEQEFREGSSGSLRIRRVESVDWAPGPSGWVARARSWAAHRVAEVPGVGGALLGSAMLGDRRRLSGTQADTDMKVAGLAHFEATSGYHLLLVGAVAEWALLALCIGRRSRGAIGLTLTGAFVLLCGARTSVVRGWIVAGLARGGGQSGRRADALSALALCASAMLCATPSALFDLAFQLSVLAVAAILIFARLVEGWTAATLPNRLGRLAGPVAVTLCAVVATMPLLAPAFGYVSTVAPMSNLVAVPLVSVSLLIGLAGLAFAAVAPPIGGVVLRCAGAFCAMLGSVASAFARVPYAAVPAAASTLAVLAGFAAALALWAWWPQPRRGTARVIAALAAACVLVALIPLPAVGGPRIVVLDVGQGDAILVSDAGHDALVDTGPTGPALLGALARQRVRRLDEVVITHLHADHYGGLASAESVLHVPRIFVPRGTLAGSYPVIRAMQRASGTGAVRELGAGDELKVGSVTLDVVLPRQPVVNAATNEASVVMVARHGSVSVLLTGDAEHAVVQAAVDAGTLGRVDVLKVGHHGSAISVDAALLAELAPRAAIISVGAGNRYGHPTPTALRYLREAGVPTYRTDLDGDVAISLGGAEPVVRPARTRASHVAQRWPMAESQFGVLGSAYATLDDIQDSSSTAETHGSDALRPQARLPHLRDRGPPPATGAGEAEEARG